MPKKLTGDCEEILNRIRQQNRKNQQTFLAKDGNRVAFNAKRREAYALKKQQLLQQEKDNEEDNEDDDEEIVSAYKYNNGDKTLDLSKIKTLSFDELTNALNKLQEMSKRNTKPHIASIKRLITITKCKDILECINKHTNKIIDELENGSKKSKTDGQVKKYSINTIKVTFDSICFVIERLLLPVSKAILTKFQDKSKIYSVMSSNEQKEKQQNEILPTFQQYENKIIEVFGQNSVMDLITKLYGETNGNRDDFGLRIINNINQTDKEKLGNNYIIIPKKGNLRIIIDNFKTKNDYEGYDLTLSKELSSKLRKFIKDNNRNVGDYLFGVEKLSKTINQANKILKEKYNFLTGTTGGINLYRKMLASAIDYDKMSPSEQVAIANKFKHTVETHKRYLRLTNNE